VPAAEEPRRGDGDGPLLRLADALAPDPEDPDVHADLDGPPDLDALTGIRSSKPTFYAEYRRTADKLARSVEALDRISQVLVATGHGPERLCREVVRAAADHLGAESVVLALAPEVLPDAMPRFVAGGPSETTMDDATVLPMPLAGQLADLRAGVAPVLLADSGLLVVPLLAGGETQGVLAAWLGWPDGRVALVPVPDSDLAVLRILANQALSALQSSDLLRRSEQLRSRTERLYDSAGRQARDLADRNAELHQAQQRLSAARQRQAMDDERHRLARELHDSVAQHVVSAGMAIEWCRGEVADGPVREQLDTAKALARVANDRLRSAIFTLSSDQADAEQGLPELLHGLRALHDQTRFDLRVRVEGRPVRLSHEVEHSLFQVASECVFNTAVHADASRAQVRLTYRPESCG